MSRAAGRTQVSANDRELYQALLPVSTDRRMVNGQGEGVIDWPGLLPLTPTPLPEYGRVRGEGLQRGTARPEYGERGLQRAALYGCGRRAFRGHPLKSGGPAGKKLHLFFNLPLIKPAASLGN